MSQPEQKDPILRELQSVRERLEDLNHRLAGFEDSRLLTIEEAAQILNVSERTVATLIADEELRSLKVKRCRRVPKEAIEEYVRARS